MKFLALFLLAVVLVAGCTSNSNVASESKTNVKEFSMDSFVVMEDGKPYPQYSIKDITVKKGDNVVIYVNVTKGTHDFNIDEFNVKSATPTGEVTKIEFVANKTGEFVYYCNLPGHRANGHWGTLKVE